MGTKVEEGTILIEVVLVDELLRSLVALDPRVVGTVGDLGLSDGGSRIVAAGFVGHARGTHLLGAGNLARCGRSAPGLSVRRHRGRLAPLGGALRIKVLGSLHEGLVFLCLYSRCGGVTLLVVVCMELLNLGCPLNIGVLGDLRLASAS